MVKKSSLSDIFGYQELFLRILSFLSPTELATIQGVDRYWSRMALDQQVSSFVVEHLVSLTCSFGSGSTSVGEMALIQD